MIAVNILTMYSNREFKITHVKLEAKEEKSAN